MCPCPLTKSVRLREVINVVFERRNRRDRGLVSANGSVRLREVSVSGGSTAFSSISYEFVKSVKLTLSAATIKQ